MKYWGVFGQFLPDTKYEQPELLSIWTNKAKALKVAKKTIEDLSWVKSISVDSDSLHIVEDGYERIIVKGKNDATNNN